MAEAAALRKLLQDIAVSCILVSAAAFFAAVPGVSVFSRM